MLEIREVADPVPSPGQELVRVEAGGLNFADLMTIQGGYWRTPKPPLVAGREFCGMRESDGQRVMGYTQWGAFAERVAAHSELLWPVPEGWETKPLVAKPEDATTSLAIPDSLFRHRAVLYTWDGKPFSEVDEVYQRALLDIPPP